MNREPEGDRPLAVATVGVFDGVHLGHQALIGQVVKRSARLGALSVCVTFFPHPEDVLRPELEIAHLAPLEDRLQLIRAIGVAEVVVIEFTRELALTSPEEFVQSLLSRFQLRELWIGADSAVGRGRTGGRDRLAAIGRLHGFEVRSFAPLMEGGVVISSTLLRTLLAAGQVTEAGQLLGRSYRLRGRVVEGEARGRTLGFPTANLALQERLCVPGDGVYAVTCTSGEIHGWPAVANIGFRPTFDGQRRSLEIHLLEFAGDLYGQDMAVDFVARLRGERKFDSPAALLAQIKEDVQRARSLLSG